MGFLRRITGFMPFGIAVAGRKRNLVFGILDPLFKSVSREDVISTSCGKMELDWNHAPERLLSYLFQNILRYYESSELGVYLRDVAAPGDTFVDIGANLGFYSLVAKGLGFHTVAVEPEPRHSAFLKRNSALFGTVLDVALSDRPGELPLYYNPENPGATSLFATSMYVKGDQCVPVRTFSDLVTQGDVGDPKRIRVIKIDVEGLEGQVVEGMKGFLATGQTPYIWCEVRGDLSGRNGGNYRFVYEVLSGFGYQMRESGSRQIVSIDDERLSQRTVFDLLFTRSPCSRPPTVARSDRKGTSVPAR